MDRKYISILIGVTIDTGNGWTGVSSRLSGACNGGMGSSTELAAMHELTGLFVASPSLVVEEADTLRPGCGGCSGTVRVVVNNMFG